MQETTTATGSISSISDVLTEIFRQEAQPMLATAIVAEVAGWIETAQPRRG